MLIQLIPYQPDKYKAYLNLVRKVYSSSEILGDYLSIRNNIKNLIPQGVELKLRNAGNTYFLYLYSENSSITQLYTSYNYLIELLSSQFNDLSTDSGFIDTKRRNLVLVLGYYEKSA